MVKIKHFTAAIIALLALGVIAVMCLIWRGRVSDGGGAESNAGHKGEHRVVGMSSPGRPVADRPSTPKKRLDRKGRLRRATASQADPNDGEAEDDMSPEDRRLMDAIDKGRDEDDLELLVKVIPAVSASTNAEVRAELVDAIGWFDVKGMNHLLPFMADPDDDVRESAIDNWTSALGEVEDEKMRAQMVGAVMQVLTDQDALESMVNELIDMDERVALQTLVDVIEGGKAAPQGVAVAREQYEFLTGEEYTNLDAANQWLAENYEPPEPEGGADGRERKH